MSTTKEQRRLRAEQRKTQREERTAEDQLAILDQRLGPGIGAERERARLTLTINGSNQRGESS